MSEEEIRLDQTQKVFDTLAKLICSGETCSYRDLIYDLLGFKQKDYCTLISGIDITNMLCVYQDYKKRIAKAKKIIRDNYGVLDKYGIDMLDDILTGVGYE